MPEDLKVQALNAARFDAPVPEEADKFAHNKAAERKAAGRSPFYEPGKDPYPKWSPDQYWEKPAIMPDVPKKEYKPFGVLPFKEDESGIHFDPNAGLLGPITRGLKIAHQAAPKLLGGEGRFDINNPEDFKAVQDLAGLAMTGSLAGTKPTGALSSGISRPEKPLMAVHNLSLNNLYKGTQAGGLPAPSVAIKDTTSPFNKFGEVSLIGSKEFAEPNRDLNVFGGDAYTPSVWSSSEDANKIAKDLARQSPRVIPEHVADPNTLIAHNIPEFKTLEEIKNASHLLTDEQKAKAAQDLFDSYVAEDLQSRMPKIKPSRGGQHQDEEYQYWQSLVDDEKRKQHYPNLSPEMQEEIESLPELVRQLPQEYFESKYKGVANSQYNPLAPSFKGAIVPVQDLAESRRLLKKLGITDIIPIDANDPEARLKAYEQFKHLHFADGGKAKTNALQSKALKVANK
jgi:hypothetical protein